MLTFLYFFVDGMMLLLVGYAFGRLRPLKRMGLHFTIEKDKKPPSVA